MNVLVVKCSRSGIIFFIKRLSYFHDQGQPSFVVKSALAKPAIATSEGYLNCAELVGSIIYQNTSYNFYCHAPDPDDAYALVCCASYFIHNGIIDKTIVRKRQSAIYFQPYLYPNENCFIGINVNSLFIRVNLTRTENFTHTFMYKRWYKMKSMLEVKDFSLTNDNLKEPSIIIM